MYRHRREPLFRILPLRLQSLLLSSALADPHHNDEDLPAHLRGGAIAAEAEVFEKAAPGGADTFFSKGLSLDSELETHEKCILLAALKRAHGVQKRAAEILGINYRSLRHRLEKYDLSPTKQSFDEEA